jgi:hypothetical protein
MYPKQKFFKTDGWQFLPAIFLSTLPMCDVLMLDGQCWMYDVYYHCIYKLRTALAVTYWNKDSRLYSNK